MQNDGGPAFPGPESHGDDHEGMSLRDYFAAAALQGMLVNGFLPAGVTDVKGWDYPKAAYQIADAMLKERLRGDQRE